ncbi:hypothetical protein [Rhodothermus marinus]|jgi:hypothetical protein|uniref:hypothetical protein n=1 Tax=Rhodothermus marinus TaxID=29549 RepID=UPI000223DA08|nr:hypothetical protein [Rhodothermus marinus]AEN72994.1 conserved hypothetical protein, membrane [Rhodothermus marinus SG0.5JP17-172]MBO2492701.1 hypothetical protein [Rhodothermus marinus]BBM70042.1 hypothetical protein RmaAA213_18880 [Rhodothermus marinus]
MEGIVPLAIWAALILLGLGLVAQVIFGLRNLTYGKISPISMLIVVLPVLLMVVLGFTVGSWAQAGVITVLVMFVLTAIALLLSGLRNMFSF